MFELFLLGFLILIGLSILRRNSPAEYLVKNEIDEVDSGYTYNVR